MPLIPNFGVLGINARNLLYIRPYNQKKAIRLADDKLKTKQFLSARDIPVPRLYATIDSHEELEKFDFSALPSSFVLKPNRGYGGEGIIPFVGRQGSAYEKSSGDLMTQDILNEHIGDILEGRFSLSGDTDLAFFEQLIICDDRLAEFSYKGLPDIRIIVHNLIPVMAMLRLPTRASDGKANLHLGALGVGIDIAKGTATHVSLGSKIIDSVPDVGPIRGLKIPYWDELLHIASRVQLISNLGYLAVDLVIDKNTGPVLLEINARAGLRVQLANLAPLRKRLQQIKGIKVPNPKKGVRVAQDLFGYKVEREVKKVSGKTVVGSREKVKLFLGGESRVLWASINPIVEESFIDQSLVDALQIPLNDETGKAKVKLNLADQRIQTLVTPEDLKGKAYDLILGRRDLQSFLIDPALKRGIQKKLPTLVSKPNTSLKSPLDEIPFKSIDHRIVSVDKQIKLLYHMKPINFTEEKKKALKDKDYNPQFIYPELQFDPFHLKQKLKKVEKDLDDSSLGLLLKHKVDEIYRKIDLLEHIGTESFEDKSDALFAFPDEDLLALAWEKWHSRPRKFEKLRVNLTMEEAISRFERVFREYGLNDWRVKVKKTMISRCLAGKNKVFFVRDGAKFSPEALDLVVAHEIETHILTAENGKVQDFELFSRGFADYLETQEGLAIWNQSYVTDMELHREFKPALMTLLLNFARYHSFAETRAYAQSEFGLSDLKAVNIALRLKRGLEDSSLPGAFSKSALYFRGYLQIKGFVEAGGDLKDLYYGKYNLKDLATLQSLGQLRPPRHLPRFLLGSQ